MLYNHFIYKRESGNLQRIEKASGKIRKIKLVQSSGNLISFRQKTSLKYYHLFKLKEYNLFSQEFLAAICLYHPNCRVPSQVETIATSLFTRLA